MPEYLTKEEIRQWRSSLERITLEEYAARLGKIIQGEKETNDMIDKVMTHSLNSMQSEEYNTPHEKLQTITLSSMFESKSTTIVKPKVSEGIKIEEKEVKKDIKNSSKKQKEKSIIPSKEEVKKSTPVENIIKEETKNIVEAEQPKKEEPVEIEHTKSEVSITFKKPLIPREQMIFDYLVKNKGAIVYAKDMAALLELPRDYVYKYIKNLRQKINEDVLVNADNGGYTLKV